MQACEFWDIPAMVRSSLRRSCHSCCVGSCFHVVRLMSLQLEFCDVAALAGRAPVPRL